MTFSEEEFNAVLMQLENSTRVAQVLVDLTDKSDINGNRGFLFSREFPVKWSAAEYYDLYFKAKVSDTEFTIGVIKSTKTIVFEKHDF